MTFNIMAQCKVKNSLKDWTFSILAVYITGSYVVDVLQEE
jgi:hypothetical protein